MRATFGNVHRGINRGETIRRAHDCWHGVAGRNVAARLVADAGLRLIRQNFIFPFAAAKAAVNSAPEQRSHRLQRVRF
jgi:hypothetical protein